MTSTSHREDLRDIISDFETPIRQTSCAVQTLLGIAETLHEEGPAQAIEFIARALGHEVDSLEDTFDRACRAIRRSRPTTAGSVVVDLSPPRGPKLVAA